MATKRELEGARARRGKDKKKDEKKVVYYRSKDDAKPVTQKPQVTVSRPQTRRPAQTAGNRSPKAQNTNILGNQNQKPKGPASPGTARSGGKMHAGNRSVTQRPATRNERKAAESAARSVINSTGKPYPQTGKSGLLSPQEKLLADTVLKNSGLTPERNRRARPKTTEELRNSIGNQLHRMGQNYAASQIPVSPYDRGKLGEDLPYVQQAKQRFEAAKAAGDTEGMARAHGEAEGWRRKHGYSGGAAGDEYITAQLSQEDYNRLNPRGQERLTDAKLRYDQAATDAERQRIAEEGERIRRNPLYQAALTAATDANGRRMRGVDMTPEERARDAHRVSAGLASVGQGVAGSMAYLGQQIQRVNRDQMDAAQMASWIRDDANYNQALTDLENARAYRERYGHDDPEGISLYAAERAFAAAQQARAQLDRIQHDPRAVYFDPTAAERLGISTDKGETFAEGLLRQAAENRAAATEGLSGFDRFMTDALLSVGQSAPAMALSAIPGVGPELTIGVLGAQAAGQRAYDLGQEGVDAETALLRGLVSGSIEAMTERVPVSNWTRILEGRTGRTALRNLLIQSGEEATEESVSYLANWAADKAARDPNAHLSFAELLENAGMGAVGGAVFGGAGSVIGAARRGGRTAQTALSPLFNPASAETDPVQREIQELIAASNDYQRMADNGLLSQEELDGLQNWIQTRISNIQEENAAPRAQDSLPSAPPVFSLPEARAENNPDAYRSLAESYRREQIQTTPAQTAATSAYDAMQRRPSVTQTAQEIAAQDTRTPVEKATSNAQDALRQAAYALQAREAAERQAALNAEKWAAEPSEDEGIKVYRGVNRSESPLDKNLVGMQTANGILGKPEGAPDLIPVEYYTESREDAGHYADQDRTLLEDVLIPQARQEYNRLVMEGRTPDVDRETWARQRAKESYKALTGRDAAQSGRVEEKTITPRKVLDLSKLGEKASVNDIYRAISDMTGISENELDDALVLMDLGVETSDDLVDVFRVLRNEGAGPGVGTRFYNLLASKGYDAVKYAESGTNHYAVLPQKAVAEGTGGRYNEGKKAVKEDNSNGRDNEQMDAGRADLRGGEPGQRGLPDAGHAPEPGEGVSGSSDVGDAHIPANEENAGDAGTRSGRPNDSLRPEPGGDVGHPGDADGQAVSGVAGQDAGGEAPGRGLAGADATGGADVTASKAKPQNKNKHNHQITEDIDSKRPNFNDNVAAIKLMKSLVESGKKPTKEEMAVLAKYKGWGALKDILNENSYYGRQLKGLLTKEEYEAAKLSVLNAHYTSTKVISAMYDAVKRLGFKGGRVLEPSMGTGNFFGVMPKSMARASDLYGVELDSVTGNIAKLLYPDAKIDVAGFQDVLYPDGTFDLVIGNVPFSNEIKVPYRGTSYNLHDFFFVKALDETRPGGVVALITSTGTLDKISGKTQRAISDRANLLAAFRLPDDAFKTNAGTEVTTDLLFLQRKGPGIADNEIAFQKIGNIDGIPINEYFVEHPKNILGTLAREKGMYASERTVVHGDGRDMQEALAKAFRTLPKDIMQETTGEQAARPVTAKKRGQRNRAVFQTDKDGKVSITDSKTGEVIEYGNATKKEKEKAETVREYIDLKDTFLNLLDTENNGGDGSALREQLNQKYDAFVEKHGPLSSKENKRLLSPDGDYIRTTGIEVKAKDGYDKSDIFRVPTVSKRRKTHADTAEEALSISLNETGKVDLARMQKLTGRTEKQLLDALKDEIIQTPDGDYQLIAQYASGNIYQKLDQIEGKSGFDRQRKVLKDALPRRKGPDEIDPAIGSHWIAPKYVADFIEDTFESSARVTYNKELGQWAVSLGWTGVKRFNTDRMSAQKILEATLNGKNVVVKDKDSEGKSYVNEKETKLAQAKQDDLREAFRNWAFADKARAEALIDTFNRTLNAFAPMNYEALADRIDFGVNPNSRKQPRDYQKAAAARIVFGGNTLLHNGVGTGKTLTMIIAAHALKQAGIANKPMFVVPNGKVEDFRSEILEAYPDAKILALDNESMSPKQVQATKSLIATGDWDYVIIYRSAFSLVPLSPELAAQSLQRQLDIYEEAARDNAGDRNGDKRFEKGLKSRMETMRNRINALLDKPRDESTYFDDMGIDALFVDEAHNFKKVGFPTTFNFSGIVADTNEMTTDLYMKEEYLRDRGNRIVLATATPITNAISEMYNMTMHVAPEVYRDAGIYSFDAWANTFVNIESQAEIASDGKTFRRKERARNFKNANALFGLYRQFADIKLTQDVVKGLPKAEVVTVTSEGSDLHKQILQYLSNLPAEKTLQMNNDGKAAASDLRLVTSLLDEMGLDMTPEELDLPTSKINKAVGFIVDEYQKSAGIKGTQFVFLDIGIGQSKTATRYNYNLYGDLIGKLVKAGIPKEEIAKIGDYDGEDKRQILYDKMNRGDIRVLIGSTAKMGEGVNAQERAVALHHLSVPYRPDNLEQREGRIVRSGNINKDVRIYKYIQEESYDSYLWQMIERKAAYLAEAYNGGDATEVDELSEAQVNAREAKAIATGNPLIVEKMNLQDKISRLRILYRGWQGEQYDAKQNLEKERAKLAEARQKLSNAEVDKKTVAEAKKKAGDSLGVTIGKKSFDKRKDAAEALTPWIEKKKTGKIGTVYGLEFGLQYDPQSNEYRVYVRGEGEYVNTIGDSAIGNLARIINLAEKGPESVLGLMERSVQVHQSGIRDAERTMKTPFKQQKELEQSQARMREIDQALGVTGNVEVVEDDGPTRATGDVQYSKRTGTAGRPEDWTTERIRSGSATAPRPLSEIIAQIQHDLGLNVTYGHVRGKDVQGQFNRRDKGIRSRLAQDLPTISHEIGHWFDDRFGLTDGRLPAGVGAELKEVLGDQADQYSEKELKGEGLAEFFRAYLTNRETAAIDYPNTTKYVLEKLDAQSLARLFQFADEINAYYSMDADSASSSIRSREEGAPDFRTYAEKIQDMGEALYHAWIDSNYPIQKLDRETGGDAYIYATNAAYSDAVAGRIITGDLTDMNGQYVGSGLKTALHGINTRNKKEWRDFGEYLVVRHGPERLAAGKRVFADDRKNSTEFMNRRRAELEEKYPAFRDAGTRLIQFERDLARTWGVGTGLISQDTLNAWNEKYKEHVPLNRAIPRERGGIAGTKRGFANQSSPFRRAKGSGLDIIHPAENIMDMVVKLVNAGTRNQVMQKITEEAERFGANATFMEKVPTPVVPHAFDMSGVKAQLGKAGNEALLQGMFTESNAETYDTIIESLDDVMIQWERGKAKGDVVTVLRGGKPEFWKINDKALLESVTSLSAPKLNGLLEAYAVTTRFMTANITGNNPIWSIFSNAPRDLATFFVYAGKQNPFKAIAAIGSAYLNGFNQAYRNGANLDPFFAEYLAMGGGHTSAPSADANLARKARKDITATAGQRIADTINPINWISFISDTIEMGPRFATYKLLRQEGMDPHHAFYHAMDITVNFRKAGYQSRQVNKVVPFFNASVQGIDKFSRFFTAADEKPGNRGKAAAARIGAWVTASAIFATLFYLLNNRDEEKKEDYQQLSNYTKNTFFVIPLGEGKYFAIPKPRELAVVTSLFETGLEYWGTGNDHAFDEFYDYVTDNFLPSVLSDLAKLPTNIAADGMNEGIKETFAGVAGSMGLFGVGFYIGANRDFLGRPIESQSMQNLEPRDRFTDSTSKMAYYIGQGLNMSPQMIDFFGNQVLGYVWKVPRALFPVGDENRDITLGVKNSYIKDNLYSQDLVNWLYDRKDKSERAANSNQDDMDKVIAAKNDDIMTAFYGRFNKLNNGNTATDRKRAARQTVLAMIYEYRKNADVGTVTPVQEAVYDVIRQSGSTELMPAAMQPYIKTDDARYDLTDAQYVEYQTSYNGFYWSLAEEALSGTNPDRKKSALLRQVKATAKEEADKAMLSKLGVNTEETPGKYGTVSAQNVMTFKAGMELANDDGSLLQEEVITVIEDMVKNGLSKEDASTLFRSKYKSDKNNPWAK